MKRTHHGRVIETSIRIKTSPQQASDAWADPRELGVLREAGKTWPAERALLGLKSFEIGPQQMVALDLSVWSASALRATADREARLNRALDRLVKVL